MPLPKKLASFAYSMWNARDPETRFLGGDLLTDYLAAAGVTRGNLVHFREARGGGDRRPLRDQSARAKASRVPLE
jgi:hypothetical protein